MYKYEIILYWSAEDERFIAENSRSRKYRKVCKEL